jgi:hypothetical protein
MDSPTDVKEEIKRPSPSPSHATHRFFDKDPEHVASRKTYLKIFLGGSFTTIFIIFAIFPIFYGALWKTPVNNLPGWIVDFDGGLIGQRVTQALTSQQLAAFTKVSWTVVPASLFPGGSEDLAHAVLEERTWVALSVNSGSSANLLSAISTPNPAYNGSQAITVFAVEARNEGAYRGIIMPSVLLPLAFIGNAASAELAKMLANSSSLSSILTNAPQTISTPISYTVRNLAPFDQPIATGVIFVGLIFQLIIALFVVMAAFAAREKSGLGTSLTFTSLLLMRFASIFGAFSILSLLYCLLTMAFQLRFTREFGKAGFLIFWMLNYANMLACGLAVEAVLTIVPLPGLPFFIILWIIANVSVCPFPIEILPSFYRYGYAAPFYNVSRGIRTVLFATKNRVGLSFGVLIAWIAISCLTIPLFQWIVRRKLASKAHSVE